AGQRSLDKKPVAPNVLPGAQGHLRLLQLGDHDAQPVLFQQLPIVVGGEPLHRRRLAAAAGARLWVVLAEPAERPPRPEMVEALAAWRIGTGEEGAVAGEEAAWGKHSRDLGDGVLLVGDEVDGIAEEDGIRGVDDV